MHATAYWDASRREWSIVDMGSVHGTFVRPASAVGDSRGVRLSPPRQASIPRALKHMDRLTIGGTTFLIHMHQDQLRCEDCWLSGEMEISLFPVSKTMKSAVCENTAQHVGSFSPQPQKDPKKALTMLKHNLLARHNVPSSDSNPTQPTDHTLTQYIDRSARRRALMPATHPDAPGIPSPSTWSEPPRPKSPPLARVTSQLPIPLSASNIGHRLLMKQGWEPGTALGSELDPSQDRIGLVEPLEIEASSHRAGLGLKRNTRSTFSDPDWKESAKRKRWDSKQ